MSLVLTRKVLAYTKGLSIKLQGRYVDIVRAYRDINSVKDCLKKARISVDTFHESMYVEVKHLGDCVGIEESRPRFASRQQHRSNVSSNNISDHYKLNLTIPVLDHIINELDTRFASHSSTIVNESIKIVPSEIFSRSEKLEIQNLLEYYSDDLPAPISLDVELDMWCNSWAGNELAEGLYTPEKALRHIDKDYFPNIHTFMVLMVTLPVTSCESERSISLLKFIKSKLRSSMVEERLNALTLMYFHKDVHIDTEEVVTLFAQAKPKRRLELL